MVNYENLPAQSEHRFRGTGQWFLLVLDRFRRLPPVSSVCAKLTISWHKSTNMAVISILINLQVNKQASQFQNISIPLIWKHWGRDFVLMLSGPHWVSLLSTFVNFQMPWLMCSSAQKNHSQHYLEFAWKCFTWELSWKTLSATKTPNCCLSVTVMDGSMGGVCTKWYFQSHHVCKHGIGEAVGNLRLRHIRQEKKERKSIVMLSH